ncbi:MAG TPA: SRPBCC family protein [Jatrophihabitans sp.]|nr:SRPBCC family protein [Jatrophihabitans sp.]
MTDYTHSEAVVVAVSPETLYDLVSDVTRTGEWSPTCTGCVWDDGAGPQVGAWFTGYNATPARQWQTRSRVVTADRGTEFAWAVGEDYVRWSFRLAPHDGGTLLTETWQFTPAGQAMFAQRYGDDAPAQIADRTQMAHEGIPATLAAIKRIAEAG